MVNATISPFSPATASDAELVDCYDAATSAYAVDFPDRKLPTREAYISRLKLTESYAGPQQFWVARVSGRICGLATLILPAHENQHSTITKIQVEPPSRRSGIGTALLHATIPIARAAGRTTVTGKALKVGASGQLWAHALGFASVQQFVLQALHVPDVNPNTWIVPVPAGFRIESWIGATPESLVEEYAEARTAIADAPVGDSSSDFPEWSVDRVRKHELNAEERGRELRVVAVQHAASGRIAGLTEIELDPTRPDLALQMDTAVRRAYRGNGLGRLIKAHMMQWLVDDREEVERVATSNAADNTHMIRINAEIGYGIDYTVTNVEVALEALLVDAVA